MEVLMGVGKADLGKMKSIDLAGILALVLFYTPEYSKKIFRLSKSQVILPEWIGCFVGAVFLR